ncbi:MAG: DUF1540 domain-containing protein [Clostridiales bacterium]|nr:DUF1540 domain-containing protein [Clostridiales bacterium]
MDNKNCNHSIECTVTQCANHSTDDNFCALNRIRIGTHEKNPTVVQCTDCESFILKNSGCRCSENH